jgi:hypothetical protein
LAFAILTGGQEGKSKKCKSIARESQKSQPKADPPLAEKFKSVGAQGKAPVLHHSNAPPLTLHRLTRNDD